MAKSKVVVVMPAYNAEKTLHMTYAELPHDIVDLVILVDDGSSDETLRIAVCGPNFACTDLNWVRYAKIKNLATGAMSASDRITDSTRTSRDVRKVPRASFRRCRLLCALPRTARFACLFSTSLSDRRGISAGTNRPPETHQAFNTAASTSPMSL